MDAFLSNPKNLIIVGVLIVALYYVFTKFLGKKKPEEPKKAFKDTLRYLDKSKYAGRTQWTMEEVNQHNNKDDCWLVMNNRIYDVSPFIPVHPGGDSIFKNAGKDNTVGFFGPQHGRTVFEMVEEYYIGDVVETKKDM